MNAAPALSAEEWAFWDEWMRAQRLVLREADRLLQREFGISKAEFSVLVTLTGGVDGEMRVTALAEALDWDKGRVSHLLTRMEGRGLLVRREAGATGRRTGIALTAAGRDVADRAILGHGRTLRVLALERLDPEQRAAISRWSRDLLSDATLSTTEQ